MAGVRGAGARVLHRRHHRRSVRHAAEECKRSNVPVAEGFRRLCRIADNEAGIRVRQVKSEEVDLALYAPNDADGFTKVGLSMPWRMHQRYEHLLSPLPPLFWGFNPAVSASALTSALLLSRLAQA
jgi:hypothetical protein